MVGGGEKTVRKNLYEDQISIERVGKKDPKRGPFLVEAKISEGIKTRLLELGIDITGDAVTGLLEDGNIMVDMNLVSDDFEEGDPFLYIESVEKGLSGKEVARTLFEGVSGVRAKLRMVVGTKDKLVARVTLVLKKKEKEKKV